MGIYSCVFVISEKLDRTVTLALRGLGDGLGFLDFLERVEEGRQQHEFIFKDADFGFDGGTTWIILY